MPLKKARLKISDYSVNRKATVSKTERRIRMVSLSLTSMVDMFAILVIFLLSSQDAETPMLDFGHGVQLPKAKTAAPPPKGITLQIAQKGVYFESKQLLAAQDFPSQNPQVLFPLQDWLNQQAKKESPTSENKKRINLVADERLPYGNVKRVVAMARKAGFSELSLAVEPTR